MQIIGDVEGKNVVFKATITPVPEVTLGEYKGLKVPEVLLSGNFTKIEKWREDMAYEHTKNRRPDLLEN